MRVSRIFAIVLTAAAFAHPMLIGPAFFAGTSTLIGFDFRFSHFYGFRPNVSLNLGDPDSENVVKIEIDNHFFLPDLTDRLQQYIGIAPIVNLGDQFHDWQKLDITNYYGLQCSFGKELASYTHLGYKIVFDRFRISTFAFGIGVIFYVHT